MPTRHRYLNVPSDIEKLFEKLPRDKRFADETDRGPEGASRRAVVNRVLTECLDSIVEGLQELGCTAKHSLRERRQIRVNLDESTWKSLEEASDATGLPQEQLLYAALRVFAKKK